ncbi:MAG: hypothetical protein ACUZ8I_14905 [Candidatus Scalindua sp.]
MFLVAQRTFTIRAIVRVISECEYFMLASDLGLECYHGAIVLTGCFAHIISSML